MIIYNMKKLYIFILPFLFLASCVTHQVTIIPPSHKGVSQYEPQYVKSHSFFLFGLIGEEYVNVKNICQGSKVRQMRSQFTFLDHFIGIITLGIYYPQTVKVWCYSLTNKQSHQPKDML